MNTNQTNLDTGNTQIGGFRFSHLLVGVGMAIAWVTQASLAPAGITHLGEPFNYADGVLDGRGTADTFGDFSNWGGNFEFGGSQWNSNWTTDPTSSLGFSVTSNTLSLETPVGSGLDAPEGYWGSVSRGISLGDQRNGWTFAGTFTLVGDTAEDYAASMGFGSAAGDTARMGVKNGQFVMQFGDQPEVSAGQVKPNTPYTLVAQVKFGVPVTVGGTTQTGESMKVWVNETYQRLNEEVADLLMSVESASGMTGLGNSLRLSALASPNFANDVANTLQWDDLFLGTYYQDVNGYRHDIGPNELNVQEGYYSWDAGRDGLAKTFPNAETGYGDVTITIDGRNVRVVDGGGAGGVADNLKRDGVKADGELTLSFDGLDTGIPPEGDPYVLKMYHHALDDQLNPIDIYVDVDGEDQFVTTVNPSTGDSNPTHTSIGFSALEGDAYFHLIAQDGGVVWLNGFELVPEPSSSIMIIMGLVGLVGCRRRRRQNTIL